MVRIAFALSLLLVPAANAQSSPAGLPPSRLLASPNPALLSVVPPDVQFMSTKRADVIQAINQMQSQLVAFDPVLRDDAISVGARSFAERWSNIADAYHHQQTGAVEGLIDDLLVRNADQVTDFLNTPPMDPMPSLFSDPLFTDPPEFPLAGFFGS